MLRVLIECPVESEGFLERPLDGLAQSVLAASPEVAAIAAGRRVGPYELVREVGSGGAGVVFLAQREIDGFEQRVAIKFLQPSIRGQAVWRRFENERGILARLRLASPESGTRAHRPKPLGGSHSAC